MMGSALCFWCYGPAFGLSLHRPVLHFPDAISQDQICQCVRKGDRPDETLIPGDSPKEIITLMKKCWEHDPQKRPRFKGLGFGYLFVCNIIKKKKVIIFPEFFKVWIISIIIVGHTVNVVEVIHIRPLEIRESIKCLAWTKW